MKWYKFDKNKGSRQKRPPQHRFVLLVLEPKPLDCFLGLKTEYPISIAIGYLKYAAGDRQSPQFIVPGIGRNVIAWCDCLGDNFEWPHKDELPK